MVRGAARSPFALSLFAVAVFAVVNFPQILELAAALVVLNVVFAGDVVVNQGGDNLEHELYAAALDRILIATTSRLASSSAFFLSLISISHSPSSVVSILSSGPLLSTMTCIPPYHPCPGHESTTEHDRCAQCLYYVVFEGFVRGIYSNSWIARDQTERYTDSRQKSFKKKGEADAWWALMCTALHQNGCRPFEPVNFPLDVSTTTHPSSAPCTHAPAPTQAAAAAPVPAAGPVSAAGPVPAVSVTSTTFPMPAPSPFSSPLSSRATTEPASPTPKKEEDLLATPNLYLNVPPRVTPLTRVQLTPTGVALGANLIAQRVHVAAQRAEAAPPSVMATPARAPATIDADALPAAMASVLVTPGPQAPILPAPPSAAAPPRVRQYGIRGVAVFYNSHAAAAVSLGLVDAKIMVSDNPDKLEAWMMGKPFVGEE
ncbi:hypothetical protein B0H13DRAFT_1853711 [Mycena leptocephala]|nr:hypothetical protein B0H13DRAFT_1853711 [Mycena leptocephala]